MPRRSAPHGFATRVGCKFCPWAMAPLFEVATRMAVVCLRCFARCPKGESKRNRIEPHTSTDNKVTVLLDNLHKQQRQTQNIATKTEPFDSTKQHENRPDRPPSRREIGTRPAAQQTQISTTKAQPFCRKSTNTCCAFLVLFKGRR